MARRRVKTASPTLGALAGLSEFTDIEPIAAGGTSQVFRARQPAMDRLVAIKILGLAAADPQVRVRFERELVITGHLSQHPLFVTVYGHGISAAGYPFLVMPWYDGGSLGDVVGVNGPVPVPAALTTGVRMAAALAHLHAAGFVHRGVKPSNVLLTTLGESVLAAFGGASWTHPVTGGCAGLRGLSLPGVWPARDVFAAARSRGSRRRESSLEERRLVGMRFSRGADLKVRWPMGLVCPAGLTAETARTEGWPP